jgi:hypothetical protein
MLEAPGSQGDLHVRKRVMEVERVMKSGRKLVKGTTLDFVVSPLFVDISKGEANGSRSRY